MAPFTFRLKKPNDIAARYVHFEERPSWEVLSSAIAQEFSISFYNVNVIFITKADGDITVRKEQDLQSFYEDNPSSKTIKGIVQDLQTPDSPHAIHSTWSTGSDLSDLANANDRLSLFCWVINVPGGNPFPVNIEKSLTVGHLKKEIKKENELAFDAINPNTFELWKLSSPIPSAEIGTKLRDVQSPQQIPGCVKLNAMDELSVHFSSAPRNHLHIIVEAPPTLLAVGNGVQSKKRNITPKEHTVGIEVIDLRIEQELKSLRVVVETFLKNPEPPTWVPPDYATPSNCEFLESLRIPSYRNGNPSLLFHDLHVCDGDEITKIFGDARHLCICNTSGSGKTRRMLEGLTKYWGFYLVAVPDVNGVGIRDLKDVLDEVTKYPEWISDLSPLSSEERAVQSDLNSLIASKLLKKVLVARIVVFQLFIKLAIQVDGELQEKHKRIWLLFQLSDHLDPRVGTLHPFVCIMRRCLHQASAEALDMLAERLDTIRVRYLPPSRFIVGLDEAQQAVRLYRHSFTSSTNNEVLRSILREIVQVFTRLPIKLVVSGTGLSLEDLEEAVASGVSKPAEAVILFHELGMFDTWPKLKEFLERYVPASFSETPSGCHLQQRIREYLLGRYRFSVSFLEYFLRNGLQSPHKLLNEYIKGHTTYLPGDSGLAFTSKEPELHITVRVIGFEWNRLQNDPSALQEAARIVQSHFARGKSPTFGPVTARLVEYGIARLRERHQGQIVEPLAFLSLMKWLENQPNANLQRNIRLRLAEQSSRGEAYEQLIENPTTTPAVLVPSNLFGPDVMVWCGDVLLMGQLKSYTEGNKEPPDATTMSYALTSLRPDHWFKQSPPHLRQKLIHAIERHRVLRFVGGYPLPPNLNLGGKSVSNALTELGPNVVLATINLDAFRAHFVTEDQARDVLGPMGHALTRKRKADEMDSGN